MLHICYDESLEKKSLRPGEKDAIERASIVVSTQIQSLYTSSRTAASVFLTLSSCNRGFEREKFPNYNYNSRHIAIPYI